MRNRLAWCLSLFLSAAVVAQETIVRIPEEDAKKAATTRVDPVYPPMARQMRLGGKVQVDAFIDESGTVERVQPVSGNPVLSSAAATALKKWKFTPFQANGKPAKAVANIAFDFKL